MLETLFIAILIPIILALLIIALPFLPSEPRTEEGE